ncbi:MAG: prealbumin-like fold domain-containing protein, partial [Oscillospiraceae bacterium]|nr:prealbumin-like fold domain-containing protein [Oscillospiraceae bacterium]
IGIPEGTVFTVSEQRAAGFTQVLPADTNGYVNETVGANVSTLPFGNNTADEPDGTLTVSKTVISEALESAPDADFTFRLSVLVGTDYQPLPDAVYSVGGNTFKTDEDGLFTLRANQTATFDRLKLTATYKVEELPVKDFSPQQASYEEQLTKSGVAFDFTNVYKSNYALKLVKVDSDNNEKTLANAVFRLEKLTDQNTVDPVFSPITLKTGSDGTVTLPGLTKGSYRLTEVSAPLFYNKTDVIINIDTEMTEDSHTLEDDGYTVTADIGDDGVKTITVTAVNEPHVPDTGVLLDSLPYVLILVLVIVGVVVLVIRRRRRDND